MSYGVIYLIRNNVNGKEYVGQTIQGERVRFHRHSSKEDSAICRAIEKYGKSSFTVGVLAECESKEEMDRMEAHHILVRSTMAPNGYNVMPNGGSNAGGKHTPEFIEKRIAPLRGRKRPEEFGRKLSAARRGRPQPWSKEIVKKATAAAHANAHANKEGIRRWVEAGRAAARLPENVEKRRGEGNGRSKLNWEKVRKIRQLYEREGVSQEELARRFDAKQTTISRVVRRKTWTEDPIMRPDED